MPDAHDALMDARSEARYDAPDGREREEDARYKALSGPLSDCEGEA